MSMSATSYALVIGQGTSTSGTTLCIVKQVTGCKLWENGTCTKILLIKARHVGLTRKSVFLEDRRCRRKALVFQEILPYIVMRFVRSHDADS